MSFLFFLLLFTDATECSDDVTIGSVCLSICLFHVFSRKSRMTEAVTRNIRDARDLETARCRCDLEFKKVSVCHGDGRHSMDCALRSARLFVEITPVPIDAVCNEFTTRVWNAQSGGRQKGDRSFGLVRRPHVHPST